MTLKRRLRNLEHAEGASKASIVVYTSFIEGASGAEPDMAQLPGVGDMARHAGAPLAEFEARIAASIKAGSVVPYSVHGD